MASVTSETTAAAQPIVETTAAAQPIIEEVTESEQNETNIIVSGFSKAVTEEELYVLLSSHGRITQFTFEEAENDHPGARE